MRCVALIPARGGSKGIPRKNLETIAHPTGKMGEAVLETLLARTIRHAKEADGIEAVYVSTEDQEIATHAKAAGAIVINRPDFLAQDSTSTEDVIDHAMEHMEGDIICLLQCTSPFRSPGQLDQAIKEFNPFTHDSMASVVPFHGFLWGKSKGGWVKMYSERRRRQDSHEHFVETGSFYLFTKNCFRDHRNRIGKNPTCFVVPQHDALEIDTPFDLKMARTLAFHVPECYT